MSAADHREARIAHTRQIAEDLKAAGGWDLTGYEEFLVDMAPEVIRRIFGADIPDGCMAIEIAGEWKVVGRLMSVNVQHHQDVIDCGFDIRGQRQTIAGLQSQTIDVEMDVSDHGAIERFIEARNALRTAFQMQGKIFGAEMFVTSHPGYEIIGSSMRTTLSLSVNGKIAALCSKSTKPRGGVMRTPQSTPFRTFCGNGQKILCALAGYWSDRGSRRYCRDESPRHGNHGEHHA